MTKTERKRGTILQYLDPAALTVAGADILRAQMGQDESPLGDWKVPAYLAIGYEGGQPADRKVVVVCPEGVGRTCDERGMVEIDLIHKNSIMTGWFDLYGDRLAEMVTGETVDLADHVRSFGDRLESNFWNLSRVLGGA
jgi:hypothetical protein